MSERIHVLAQQLFGKSSIQECDLQEIKNLAQRYPYFAAAQFLLLEKMKQENSGEYHAQLQKSVLYYHNPLAFEYFISSERFYTEVSFDEEDLVKEQEARNKKQDGIEQMNIPKFRENEEQGTDEGKGIEHPETSGEQGTEEVKGIEQMNRRTEEQGTEEGKGIEHPEILGEQGTEEWKDKEKTLPEPQTSNLKPETEPLAFEPFHTVDYFASQGIKLSQEEMPKDKLGKQLKSFTEWLKTMKRLPPAEMASKVDAPAEQKVEHMAEDSVHTAEVVTEAMAEVWIKQGNSQKALEVYNKLSLLNPSKKPYFAALIENLKRS